MSFFEELKRRNVFKVGIAYAVGGWLLLQMTEVLSELLKLPDTVGPIVVSIVAIGLPPGLHHDLLKHLLCLFALMKHSEGESEKRGGVAIVELLERLPIAVCHATDPLDVFALG